MLKKNIIFFLFMICSISQAQIGGKHTYQFLNLVASPRQAALGGKNITIYDDDVNQGLFNPAAINEEMNQLLAVNYGSYFGEVNYGSASYAFTYDRRINTFLFGVNYVNYGKFEGYDEFGQPTAEFSGSEVAVSAGYSYHIPNSNVFIGLNGKLITSNLESYSSFGGALDVGFIYINEQDYVNWSLVFRNMGTQFTTYNDVRESLPFEIIAGVSQELENVPVRWHLTLENLQQWDVSFSNPSEAKTSLDGVITPKKVSFLGNAMRHTIFGVELFPKKAFNVRLGYNFRRASELRVQEVRSFSGLTLGFGLKLSNLKFNYSYSRFTVAGNTSLFGLTLKL
jgi:hypothetical protein